MHENTDDSIMKFCGLFFSYFMIIFLIKFISFKTWFLINTIDTVDLFSYPLFVMDVNFDVYKYLNENHAI